MWLYIKNFSRGTVKLSNLNTYQRKRKLPNQRKHSQYLNVCFRVFVKLKFSSGWRSSLSSPSTWSLVSYSTSGQILSLCKGIYYIHRYIGYRNTLTIYIFNLHILLYTTLHNIHGATFVWHFVLNFSSMRIWRCISLERRVKSFHFIGRSSELLWCDWLPRRSCQNLLFAPKFWSIFCVFLQIYNYMWISDNSSGPQAEQMDSSGQIFSVFLQWIIYFDVQKPEFTGHWNVSVWRNWGLESWH